MKRSTAVWSLAVAAVACGLPARTHAQISVAPMIGAYTQANDFAALRNQANELRVKRESKLALGVVAELGALRGTLAYVSGATLTDEGPGNTGSIGEGTLIAGALGLVIRPIPRIVIFQPYLFAGGGLKNQQYTYSDNRWDAFPRDDSDFTLHAGIGADLMFAGFGIVAEISDFVSKNGDGDFNQHDAFALVGLKLRL